ncbi:MAG: type III-B CRISPR module RAMP protein Cmr6 [Candidatus Latescibacterota bacterium]
MEYPSTRALRPVGRAVNEAVGELPQGTFNFGLYFHKWMYVVDEAPLRDDWKRPKAWHCTMSDETAVRKGGGRDNPDDICKPEPRLDNLDVSVALFNGQDNYLRAIAVLSDRTRGKWKEERKATPHHGSWDRVQANQFLAARHQALDACAAAFKSTGYELIRFDAEMLSPLVIGLGNEHPTEKGFRFDWTLGIPTIPATGVKGVVRLAWLVNRLNEKPKDEAADFWEKITGRWKAGDKPGESLLPEEARQLFGCGEIAKPEQAARRGKVIFLDVLPATLPRLKAEIMNCHYVDYLNKKPDDKGFRGPTEDQSPNPQKFWAVAREDDNGNPVRFVFRVLVHREVAGDPEARARLEAAIKAALAEHGLGAKTAIGHGRFLPVKGPEADNAASNDAAVSPPAGPPAPPPPDPAEICRQNVELFQKGLSPAHKLVNEVEGLVKRIRAMGDEATKKGCCQALLARVLEDKKRFKEARKANKAWLRGVLELATELGLDSEA